MRKAMSSIEQDSGANTPILREDKEGGKVRKTMILGRVESEDPFKESKVNEDSIAGTSVSLFKDQTVFHR